MASSDWAVLGSSLSTGVVDRGVTSGIAAPPGGGSFIYGFNSLANTAGASGLYTAQSNFAPMAKGGSIRGAVKRGAGGGKTNFSPLLFLGLQTNDIAGAGYLLGLSDEDPSHILLRKGTLSGGLPFTELGANGVLRRSSASFDVDTWLHLRLDMVANTNGDVILKCFRSDLTASGVDVTTPSWVAIDGMADFTDDQLGVNSGSQPFTSGYAGFAFVTKDVTRRGFFDHIEVARQL